MDSVLCGDSKLRRRFDRCDDDRGAVTEDFSHATHDLGRVVANPDDRVGALPASVFDHEVERILAGPLAEVGEERDVPADEGLERPANGPEDVAGPHDDPAHDAFGLDNQIAVERESGGGHVVIHDGIPRAAEMCFAVST